MTGLWGIATGYDNLSLGMVGTYKGHAMN